MPLTPQHSSQKINIPLETSEAARSNWLGVSAQICAHATTFDVVHPSTEQRWSESHLLVSSSEIHWKFALRLPLHSESIKPRKIWFKHQWCTVNQSCKSGRAFRVGPGSGLSLSKWCQPISGLHTKLFYNIQSNDGFLSWLTFVVLTTVTSVSEVIFLRIILLANTAAFFCSLLGLVSHSFWEDDSGEEISTRWRCFGKIITYATHSLF